MANTFWILVHLGAVAAFLVVHSVSIAIAFLLRGQRDPQRVRKLARVSFGTVGITHLAMILILVSGGVLLYQGHWWTTTWVWLALAVFLALWTFMGFLGTRHYDKIRGAVGAKLFYPKKGAPPPKASPEQLDGLLRSPRPFLLAFGGIAGFAIIVWLMVTKPF